MIDVRSVIKIKNLVYKDCNCIDYPNKVRPMLIFHVDGEYDYLLKISSSFKCKKFPYKTIPIVNPINLKENFICLDYIYKFPMFQRKELFIIDEKLYLKILKGLIAFQKQHQIDDIFPIIESQIVEKVNFLQKIKKY